MATKRMLGAEVIRHVPVQVLKSTRLSATEYGGFHYARRVPCNSTEQLLCGAEQQPHFVKLLFKIANTFLPERNCRAATTSCARVLKRPLHWLGPYTLPLLL
jgi:hypothetical protein